MRSTNRREARLPPLRLLVSSRHYCTPEDDDRGPWRSDARRDYRWARAAGGRWCRGHNILIPAPARPRPHGARHRGSRQQRANVCAPGEGEAHCASVEVAGAFGVPPWRLLVAPGACGRWLLKLWLARRWCLAALLHYRRTRRSLVRARGSQFYCVVGEASGRN